MNSKTMNIVLMVIIALILVVTVVIAVMTFSNHTPQPLPMHNEENVEANVTVENTIKNEIVEQPENLSTLKNKGEIAKVRSVYTDENFKTVTVPAASTDQAVIDAVRAIVTINDNGTVVAGTNTTVTVVLVKDQAGTVTAANVSYKGKNGVTVTKQIKVQFEQATTEQQTTSTESTAQPQQ